MKRIIRYVNLVACIVLLVAFVTPAHAAQSNFQITPPPIAAPDFTAGKLDRKVGLTYIGMSGDGFSMTGYGADYIRRRAISDAFAWYFQIGMFKLNGSLSGNTMTLFTLPLSLNVEYQPLKTHQLSASQIFFQVCSPDYSLFVLH